MLKAICRYVGRLFRFYPNQVEETMKNFFVLTIGAAFLAIGLVGSAQALDLTTTSGNTLKLPAERTTKLGPNNDGVITHPETFDWAAGTGYNAGGILTFTLNENKGLGFTQGSSTQWGFVYGGSTQEPNVSDGSYEINHELVADVTAANTITVNPGSPESLDLSALTSNQPDTHEVTAEYYAVGGVQIMDGPDSAPILQTLTQYSYADTATGDTIDAIENQAMLFGGGRTLSNAHTLTIASNGSLTSAPTFQTNDQLLITLSGANAVQGLENVLLVGGASTMAFPVGGNTDEMDIALSNSDLLSMGITAGPVGTDIDLQFVLEAKSDVELNPRNVMATPKLNLADTGNGEIELSTQQIFNLVQNGTLFRVPRYTTATDQVTNVRFTSTASYDVNFDVRFFPTGSTPTEWMRFPDPIPADDSISVTKQDLMDLLSLEEGLWGFTEFRLHTEVENVTAQAFARKAANDFAFALPIHYWDGNNWMY